MNETPVRVAPKIGFVSLGCPKALVDSERIITKLRAEGYELSPSYEGADAVVVNTCGFLNSAKEESLAAIGDALAENGKVIVTGCLGVEADRILARHPGVLAITGPQQYEAVVAEVHKAVPRPHDPFLDLVPPQGIRLTPRHYAYLKISEGVEIMIDKIGKHGAVARSHWDAPEIDGNVYLRGVTRLQPGDRLEVVVHGADAYDLWASPV